MAITQQHLLGDASRWIPASVLLGWSYDMDKLQEFVTGRTFSPHWREFELNWLMSGKADVQKVPPFTNIIAKCKEAWDTGRNDYYLVQPDNSDWHKDHGLGHYVRLLTMIVRENMAANGIWAVAEGEQLQRYFENAYIVTNSMREEWIQKGKLYEHFRATNHGQYTQGLRQREQTRAVSLFNGTTSPPRSNVNGENQVQKNASVAGVKDPSNPSNHVENSDGATSSQNSISTPLESSAAQLIEKSGRVKQESLAEKENSFLDSLEADLAKRRAAVQATVPTGAAAQPVPQSTGPRKRPVPDGHDKDAKRKKSDEVMKAGPDSVEQHSQNEPLRPTTIRFSPTQVPRAKTTRGDVDPARHSDDSRILGTTIKSHGYESYRPSDRNGARPTRDPRLNTHSAQPTSAPYIKQEGRPYKRPGIDGATHGERYMQRPSLAVGHYSNKDAKQNLSGSFEPKAKKTISELDLMKVCAYELKGKTCPTRGGCSKQKICIPYSRGSRCNPNCADAHVLRTCKYKVQFGYCNKEDGVYDAICTYGHEALRKEMHDNPQRFHQ